MGFGPDDGSLALTPEMRTPPLVSFSPSPPPLAPGAHLHARRARDPAEALSRKGRGWDRSNP